MGRSAQAVLGELLALAPSGWVWAAMRDPASNYAGLLIPLAAAAALGEADAEALFAQIDPRVAVAMLPDWEAALGLPDPCAGDAPTLADRQAQAYARLTDPGGASAAYFIQFAAALGYGIEISLFAPYRVGMQLGLRLYDTRWVYAWAVTIISGREDFAVLVCEMRERAPAHTYLIISDARQSIDLGEDFEAMVTP